MVTCSNHSHRFLGSCRANVLFSTFTSIKMQSDKMGGTLSNAILPLDGGKQLLDSTLQSLLLERKYFIVYASSVPSILLLSTVGLTQCGFLQSEQVTWNLYAIDASAVMDRQMNDIVKVLVFPVLDSKGILNGLSSQMEASSLQVSKSG